MILSKIVDFIKQWQGRSANHRLFTNMVTVGVSSGGSRIALVLREILIAAVFGVNDALDAYLMAWMLPLMAINVLLGTLPAGMVTGCWAFGP